MPRKSKDAASKADPSAVALPALGWRCRPYQRKLWDYMDRGGKMAVVLWHRRAGKDLFAINWIAMATTKRPGLYWHVFPQLNQGRRIIWEGYTNEGHRFLDYFPKALRADANQHEMRLNLKTGSTYQVIGGDNVDSFRGQNPIGVVFSEYAFCDPAVYRVIRPILAANGGWAMFISTPNGANHYQQLYREAEKRPDWFAERLTIEDTGVISPKELEIDRASGVSEAEIRREYYCEWTAPMEGAYYAEAINHIEEAGQITDVPYEPALDVHTAWDIGVRDTTIILFYQIEPFTERIRIFDAYESHGEGLAHYASILKARGYSYASHNAPHDIQVREIGTGHSRLEAARQLGINFRLTPKLTVSDGIEAVRRTLPRVWIDQRRCAKLIEALKSYRKDYDKEAKVFSSKPVHDWTSHWADAMRYLAVAQHKRIPDALRVTTSVPDNYHVLAHSDRPPAVASHGFASFDPEPHTPSRRSFLWD
jgi:hypothetical protein